MVYYPDMTTEQIIRDLAERFWDAPIDSAEEELLRRQLAGLYRHGAQEAQWLIEELIWHHEIPPAAARP